MRLELRVPSFKEGLKRMMDVSYSIEQSILSGDKNPLEEVSEDSVRAQVIDNLIENVEYNCPGIHCEVEVHGDITRYKTSGGLWFGWWFDVEYSEWCFWIKHPSGEFREGSTLLGAGLDGGWECIGI